MKRILLSLVLMFGFCAVSEADIFNPLPERTSQFLASVSAPTSTNVATLLDDATSIINYLGVKEGEAYNFNQHKWVTTTGATIITYSPWNLALDVDMLNADGVVGAISWNVGNYLPTQNVPIMNLTQYLYIYAGAGAEERTEVDGSTPMKFASVIGAEFKFSF